MIIKLLNGSQIAHECNIIRMDKDDTVICTRDDFTFQAWDIERLDGYFVATSWKRIG